MNSFDFNDVSYTEDAAVAFAERDINDYDAFDFPDEDVCLLAA